MLSLERAIGPRKSIVIKGYPFNRHNPTDITAFPVIAQSTMYGVCTLSLIQKKKKKKPLILHVAASP